MCVRLAAVIWLTVATAAVSPAVAGARSLTIRVTSITVSIVPHDVGPKGASKGDTVTYRDRLLNAAPQFGHKQGAVVGSDGGTMSFTSRSTATFRGRTTLPGGTLTLKGPVTALANGGLVIPVASGTGIFAKAHGTLTVAPGQNHVLNTYELAFTALPVA
jgi:hypothetical protein